MGDGWPSCGRLSQTCTNRIECFRGRPESIMAFNDDPIGLGECFNRTVQGVILILLSLFLCRKEHIVAREAVNQRKAVFTCWVIQAEYVDAFRMMVSFN